MRKEKHLKLALLLIKVKKFALFSNKGKTWSRIRMWTDIVLMPIGTGYGFGSASK
jgi:hypothetical protein